MKTRPLQTLQDFYDFIFTNKSNPAHEIKNDLEQKYKDQIIKEREERIKNFYGQIKDKNKFRSALRALKQEHTEKILFGETKFEEKKEENYVFPNDNEIKTQFDKFNRLHQFFEEKTNDEAFVQFKEYFKVFKLINDFVETTHQNNNVAYDQAYKMLVLFGNSKPIFRDIDKYFSGNNLALFNKTPVHDTFIHSLPIHPTISLNNWRKLLTTPTAIRVFMRASEIEKRLGRAPKNIDEAMKIAVTIEYKHAEDNTELSNLFYQYHISQRYFNRALRYEKMRKKHDNLPNIVIDSKDLGKPGYFLMKLPNDAAEAYLLGEITDCCQSIHGNAKKCVIDGVTLENNGFLVWVRNKKMSDSKDIKERKREEKKELKHEEKKADQKQELKDTESKAANLRKILKTGDIRAQSYCWISRFGNLVLDSLEALNIEETIIVDMLKAYADQVLETNKDMLRITIGKGGKTPEVFYQEAKYCELMREGTSYGDAEEQMIIVCNSKEQSEWAEKIQKHIISINPDAKNLISAEKIYSVTQAKNICSLLENKAIQNYLKNSSQLKKLEKHLKFKVDIIWNIWNILDENSLCSKENIELIDNHAQSSYFGRNEFNLFEENLYYLNKLHLLNQQTFNFLMKCSSALHFKELYDLNLLNEKNLELLMEAMKSAHFIAEVILAIKLLNYYNMFDDSARKFILDSIKTQENKNEENKKTDWLMVRYERERFKNKIILQIINQMDPNKTDLSKIYYHLFKNFYYFKETRFLLLDLIKRTTLENFNKSVYRGESLLHLFFKTLHGNEDDNHVLKALIEKGADLNKIGADGLRPIHIVVKKVHLPALGVLLNEKIDFTAVTKDLSNVLHLILQADVSYSSKEYLEKQKVEILAKLLTKNSIAAIVNDKNIKGETPFLFALQNNNFQAMELLISKGAKYEELLKQNLIKKCISFCKQMNSQHYPYLTKIFIDFFKQNPPDPDILGREIGEALEWGREFSENGLQFLLDLKPNINAQGGSWTFAPLHGVARGTNLNMLELILACKPHLNPLNNHGYTPLDLAVDSTFRTPDIKVCLRLLEAGALPRHYRNDEKVWKSLIENCWAQKEPQIGMAIINHIFDLPLTNRILQEVFLIAHDKINSIDSGLVKQFLVNGVDISNIMDAKSLSEGKNNSLVQIIKEFKESITTNDINSFKEELSKIENKSYNLYRIDDLLDDNELDNATKFYRAVNWIKLDLLDGYEDLNLQSSEASEVKDAKLATETKEAKTSDFSLFPQSRQVKNAYVELYQLLENIEKNHPKFPLSLPKKLEVFKTAKTQVRLDV